MAIAKILSYIWQHPANRGRRIAAVASFFGWQFSKRLLRQPRDIRIAQDMVLRCHPDSTSASAMIYCHGLPDYHEMRFLQRYLRPGDVFLDVGANVGVYTLLAKAVTGPAGSVLAFEPGARAAARFRENVDLNRLSNVRLFEAAVGEQAGRAAFVADADTTNRLRPDAQPGNPAAQTEVDVLVLDEVLGAIPVALGKMDIEGAEPIALRGARAAMSRASPPVWLLELNGALRDFGCSEEAFARELDSVGYTLASYDADRNRIVTGGKPWLQRDNVLAIARSALTDVAERAGASVEAAEPGSAAFPGRRQ